MDIIEHGTTTHSKASTIYFLGTACKQQRHDRFMKLRKRKKSHQVTEMPLARTNCH
jgi:hypothetical protein